MFWSPKVCNARPPPPQGNESKMLFFFFFFSSSSCFESALKKRRPESVDCFFSSCTWQKTTIWTGESVFAFAALAIPSPAAASRMEKPTPARFNLMMFWFRCYYCCKNQKKEEDARSMFEGKHHRAAGQQQFLTFKLNCVGSLHIFSVLLLENMYHCFQCEYTPRIYRVNIARVCRPGFTTTFELSSIVSRRPLPFKKKSPNLFAICSIRDAQ